MATTGDFLSDNYFTGARTANQDPQDRLLSASRPDDATAAVEIFRREFRALGYVEGKNITFEYRNAETKLDRLPGLVEELIRLKVDVIVVAATE